MASISKIVNHSQNNMIIDPTNPKHLIADDGMVLLQISSNIIMGKEVMLGMVIIDGKFVEDFPENYIDVEEPQPNNSVEE